VTNINERGVDINTTILPKLKIGDLEITVPIIQGGMGVGISMSRLAAAAANEGAVGVISAIGLGVFESDIKKNFRQANKSTLAKEIDKARSMSNGVLGVNVMEAVTDRDELLNLAVEKEVDLVFLGAGLPLRNIPEKGLKEKRTKFVPIVSSARAVQIIFKYWDKNYGRSPDAIVIEGPLAGGHLGFKKEQITDSHYCLENILSDTIPVIKSFEDKYGKKIPIIVAGGIYSGADIHKFLQLGASGVQMGTRFVATKECDANEAFKRTYINCKKEDIIIIKSPVGLPGRAIKNKFIEDILSEMKKPFKCGWKCLKTCDFKTAPYCILAALYNSKIGNLKEGFAFAGANAYKITKIISVKELITTLLLHNKSLNAMINTNEHGRKIFKKLFGDEAENIELMLQKLSPELAKIGIDFPFGEFYAKDDLLDLKTRELITISTLVTQGTLPQLKLHTKAALNIGCTPVQIEQAILQLIIYVGMPKVINAMKVFKEVIEERLN